MAKRNKTGFVNNAAICVGNGRLSNNYKGYELILIANGGVYRLHGMFRYARVNRESDF